MSIEEQRRKAFEAHIASQQGVSEKANGLWFSKYPNGWYKSGHVESLWRNWNAALDSVVIELPNQLHAKPYACYEGGWNDALLETADLIEGMGLKVKP